MELVSSLEIGRRLNNATKSPRESENGGRVIVGGSRRNYVKMKEHEGGDLREQHKKELTKMMERHKRELDEHKGKRKEPEEHEGKKRERMKPEGEKREHEGKEHEGKEERHMSDRMGKSKDELEKMGEAIKMKVGHPEGAHPMRRKY
jgi:hypothetical protein